MNSFSAFVVLIASVHLMCESVQAWGKEGHEIVATIAQDHISPDVMDTLNAYLGSSSLADIAPLPDDYDHSSEGRWSSPCHYVNLPRGSSGFSWSDCKTFCVVEAINNYTNLLSADTKPTRCNYKGVEPCPLEFLVHYVGDVHQPLHISYADDEGGNKVDVEFLGSYTNLHTLWDTKIIQKWQPENNMEQAVSELEDMIDQNPSTVKQILSVSDPVAWANESLAFTLTNAYDFPVKNGVGQIDEKYYETNLAVVQWRLIAGGLRLAQLITDALSNQVHNKAPAVQTLPNIFHPKKKYFANKTF